MTYTQTAFTGLTGARPITALTRRIARDLEARVVGTATVASKGELYRVMDEAAVALGLGAGARETLRHLIGYTRLEDWRDGRTPIVWPSNLTLADAARKTVGAIKARLRQLRDAGLILPHDAGHGRRAGRRDDSGVISSAFGLDLSPLRTRFDELHALAEGYTAQVRLFNEGRQKIARVRRLVGQALAQAACLRLTGSHWLALQDAIEQVAGLAAAARAARDSAAYHAALEHLPKVERQVGDTIDRFMFSDENDASGSKNEPDIQIQTNPLPLENVQAARNCSSDLGGRPSPLADLPTSPSNSAFKARPAELMGMFPTTAMYVGARNPTWSDIHRAAARLRHDLGIRTGCWVDALDKLGLDAAAVAVMITAERNARDEIRLTPGAYFAGMVGKAKRDELDLAKSLWGFRTERMATH
ncbi:plasmid replication protein RepC [Sphingomonas bacterium]|uniref:plasmid replication protein RepC n=1 Tax=Sphingomonas bacterium TaxID=1895847 RepID=UPI001576D719|nr:plasmid replication protein RepC [Sphingomonas bacterium]